MSDDGLAQCTADVKHLIALTSSQYLQACMPRPVSAIAPVPLAEKLQRPASSSHVRILLMVISTHCLLFRLIGCQAPSTSSDIVREANDIVSCLLLLLLDMRIKLQRHLSTGCGCMLAKPSVGSNTLLVADCWLNCGFASLLRVLIIALM